MKTHFTLISAIMLLIAGADIATAQSTFYPESYEWYRLVSYDSTDSSAEPVCVQLTPGDASEHAGMLWSAPLLDRYDDNIDYQYFTFEQNPENPEEFAMICVADPGGYVDPNPTGYDNAARWKYVFADDITPDSPSKYGFRFVQSKARGTLSDDGKPLCALATEMAPDNEEWLMTYGGSKDDYAMDITSLQDASGDTMMQLEEKNDIITMIDDATYYPLSTPKQIYDLSGRPISSPATGIYIADGKKIYYTK